MNGFTKALTFAALVGTGLVAGLFFAFGTTVMSSLAKLPAGQGAHAMNLINVRIQNPLFLLIFLGTALVSLALAVMSFIGDAPGRWWRLAGAVLYLAGVMVVSFAINIPLNDSLAAVDPNSAAGAAEWQKYLAGWNPSNNLRAVASTIAVACFAFGMTGGSSTQGAPQPPSQVTQQAWSHY
jgi:uncharacterized membrane protein